MLQRPFSSLYPNVSEREMLPKGQVQPFTLQSVSSLKSLQGYTNKKLKSVYVAQVHNG